MEMKKRSFKTLKLKHRKDCPFVRLVSGHGFVCDRNAPNIKQNSSQYTKCEGCIYGLECAGVLTIKKNN